MRSQQQSRCLDPAHPLPPVPIGPTKPALELRQHLCRGLPPVARARCDAQVIHPRKRRFCTARSHWLQSRPRNRLPAGRFSEALLGWEAIAPIREPFTAAPQVLLLQGHRLHQQAVVWHAACPYSRRRVSRGPTRFRRSVTARLTTLRRQRWPQPARLRHWPSGRGSRLNPMQLADDPAQASGCCALRLTTAAAWPLPPEQPREPTPVQQSPCIPGEAAAFADRFRSLVDPGFRVGVVEHR